MTRTPTIAVGTFVGAILLAVGCMSANQPSLPAASSSPIVDDTASPQLSLAGTIAPPTGSASPAPSALPTPTRTPSPALPTPTRSPSPALPTATPTPSTSAELRWREIGQLGSDPQRGLS